MPEIKPGSAFARDYVPTLDFRKERLADLVRKTAIETREKGMKSEDPITRLAASGTVPGMSRSPEMAARDWEQAKQIRKASGL